MSQLTLNFGVVPNDGTGDSLRAGAQKINANFTELYSTFGRISVSVGKVLTIGATLSFAGADGVSITFPSSGTIGSAAFRDEEDFQPSSQNLTSVSGLSSVDSLVYQKAPGVFGSVTNGTGLLFDSVTSTLSIDTTLGGNGFADSGKLFAFTGNGGLACTILLQVKWGGAPSQIRLFKDANSFIALRPATSTGNTNYGVVFPEFSGTAVLDTFTQSISNKTFSACFLSPVAVSALPSPASAPGQIAFVSDAVDVNEPLTGGGTLNIPVFSDGSVWKIWAPGASAYDPTNVAITGGTAVLTLLTVPEIQSAGWNPGVAGSKIELSGNDVILYGAGGTPVFKFHSGGNTWLAYPQMLVQGRLKSRGLSVGFNYEGSSVSGDDLVVVGNTGIGTDTPRARLDVAGALILGEYAVSGLPSPASGVTAYATVTDAVSPTYNGALTGGGSTKIPVFYNGSSWVSH